MPAKRFHQVAGIGYQGRTLADVLDELAERRIATVADVRMSARVAKCGFDRDHLKPALEARGIAYLHLPALGNLPENRAGYLHPGPIRDEARARYSRRLAAPDGRDALRAIWKAARAGPVVVLCMEADEHACHRRQVLEFLAEYLPVDLAPAPAQRTLFQ